MYYFESFAKKIQNRICIFKSILKDFYLDNIKLCTKVQFFFAFKKQGVRKKKSRILKYKITVTIINIEKITITYHKTCLHAVVLQQLRCQK